MSRLMVLFNNTVVLNVDRGGISMSKRIFNRVLCIAVLLILTLLLISATLRTIRNPLYTTRTPTWRLRTAVLRTTAQTRATAAQRTEELYTATARSQLITAISLITVRKRGRVFLRLYELSDNERCWNQEQHRRLQRRRSLLPERLSSSCDPDISGKITIIDYKLTNQSP